MVIGIALYSFLKEFILVSGHKQLLDPRMQALSEHIKNEQIRLVYKQAPLILIGSFLAAVVMVVSIWNQVPRADIVIWSVLFTSLAVTRGAATGVYWKYGAERTRKPLPWGPIMFIGAGLAGCLWGWASVLFYLPEQPEYILLITCIYAGLVGSSAASSGAYIPAFFYFAIPATIPFALRHLYDGRVVFILMGILLFVYLGVCSMFARTYYKNTAMLIRTQFEKEILLDQVREEKQSAEKSQRVAEQAMVEKNRFLAAASHDLRQPLHALGLFIGALRREVPKTQVHLIDSIQGSVGALNHLFNSLLDVSRLDAGVVHAAPKHSNLDVVIQRLHSEYQSLTDKRQLNFEAKCEKLVVYTDTVLLERVLRNLLVNAINYTDTGKISINCTQVHDAIEIQVSDTGIGIPVSETEAIFSEYYQLNNPERDRNKGLGLGLAIVRRLCDLMKIPISVQSTLNQGTTFTLRVKNGDRRLIDRERSLVGTAHIADLSILVIDDDVSVLQGMQSILASWGCEVILSESASDAVAKIAKQDLVPDIIFSDYRLRGNKTGIEAIDTVCEELNRKVSAVIITGDTAPALLKEAVSGGFQLLHKPVTPDAINQVLVELIGNDRL